MNLTKSERILLMNQYRILSVLNPEEKERYEELEEILQYGYKALYYEIDQFISDEMPQDESTLVFNILNVYRNIHYFRKSNNVAEIEKHNWNHFRGFDGNTEGSYMVFARFLIQKQGRYPEQQEYLAKNDECNSHLSTIQKYKEMISKNSSFGIHNNLTKEQVLEILDA